MSHSMAENVSMLENGVPGNDTKGGAHASHQSSHLQNTLHQPFDEKLFDHSRSCLPDMCSNVNNNDDGEVDDSNGADESTLPSCAQCGRPVRNSHAPSTINGPLHASCVLEYRFLHQPRCHYCDIRFREDEATSFVKDPSSGYLYHPECASREARGMPYVRPTMEGYVRKQAVARSMLSPKNWKVRYFILSPANNGIRYYSEDPTGKNSRPSGTLLTPAGGSTSSVTNNNVLQSGSLPASYHEDLDRPSSGSDNNNDEVDNVAHVVNKKSKGVVPLDRRSRLITHPALSRYPSSGPALPTHTDVIIVFYDSPESKVERRMLFECKDVEERMAWTRALEAYVHIVDDPSDYRRKAEGGEAQQGGGH